MFCARCAGSGKIMGNGMMLKDCFCLNDKEKSSEGVPVPGVDKKSASYQNAIKEIMALNPDITRRCAVAMFDKTYGKV